LIASMSFWIIAGRYAARGLLHRMLPIIDRKALLGINIQEARCHLVKDWRDRRYAWFRAEIQ
jgi:hypothetical protein